MHMNLQIISLQDQFEKADIHIVTIVNLVVHIVQ